MSAFIIVDTDRIEYGKVWWYGTIQLLPGVMIILHLCLVWWYGGMVGW